jgi:3-keto-disaccharide hydrolase
MFKIVCVCRLATVLESTMNTIQRNVMKPKCLVYLAVLCLAGSVSLRAAEGNQGATYLDPAQAGPDYADQGEYANDWGGAQVIALGIGKFHLVTYKGGFPGAGWDESTQGEMDGQRDGDAIQFKSNRAGWSYSLAKGVLSIRSDQGDTYTMNKVTRKSPTLGAKPPSGAIVLFDGTNTDAWQGGHIDDQHRLAAGTKTKRDFHNFTLHVEFMTPFKPAGRGQGRGNSGVYLQDRYEIQVLDSFGLKGENNECGGIYSQVKPKYNMCFPPLTWQTYDIDFQEAQFDASGKKTKNAVVAVKQNGVVIHDHQEIKSSTGGGKREGREGGAIQLQGHGNPVFYQNVWVVEK